MLAITGGRRYIPFPLFFMSLSSMKRCHLNYEACNANCIHLHQKKSLNDTNSKSACNYVIALLHRKNETTLRRTTLHVGHFVLALCICIILL